MKNKKTKLEQLNIDIKTCPQCGGDIPMSIYYVRDQRYESRCYISESRTRYEYNRKQFCNHQCRHDYKKANQLRDSRLIADRDSVFYKFCFRAAL